VRQNFSHVSTLWFATTHALSNGRDDDPDDKMMKKTKRNDKMKEQQQQL